MMYFIRKPKNTPTPLGIVTPEIYHAILEKSKECRQNITYIFSKLKRQLQLPRNIRFHSFRHTHATLLAEQEISTKKIQGASRTSSASFTMDRYVHNTDQLQDGIVEMIDVIGEKYGR